MTIAEITLYKYLDFSNAKQETELLLKENIIKAMEDYARSKYMEGYKDGYNDSTDEGKEEIRQNYKPNNE